MAIFFSHLPPDLAVLFHSKCCREAHGKGVEQTDVSLQGEETFAPLSSSSAKCFASLSGRSQEWLPLPHWQHGCLCGKLGITEEWVKALLNLCPGSCDLRRSTFTHGFCASGCLLLWGCLHCGRAGWPIATDYWSIMNVPEFNWMATGPCIWPLQETVFVWALWSFGLWISGLYKLLILPGNLVLP